MTQPETNYVGIFSECLFLSVCGYCIGLQSINLYRATVQLKKIRREKDNAYMNLVTHIEEHPLV
jgi:hypothetical protein